VESRSGLIESRARARLSKRRLDVLTRALAG
jgi:hypothetical protein